MAHPRTCPKCDTLAEWYGHKERKKLPNDEITDVTVYDGLRCPNCGHEFEHPIHKKVLGSINNLGVVG